MLKICTVIQSGKCIICMLWVLYSMYFCHQCPWGNPISGTITVISYEWKWESLLILHKHSRKWTLHRRFKSYLAEDNTAIRCVGGLDKSALGEIMGSSITKCSISVQEAKSLIWTYDGATSIRRYNICKNYASIMCIQ